MISQWYEEYLLLPACGKLELIALSLYLKKQELIQGKSEIDAEVVKKVWDKIAPAMASQFDAPYSVPLIAPRPLLLLNGTDDPRSPALGLQEPASKAAEAYAEAGSMDKFKDPKN